MHAYHEALPGFDPAQLLHDGCAECEARSQNRTHGMSTLDAGNFERAWQRAAEWNQRGLSNISRAEVPLLDVLWSVQVHLERCGWGIGELPHPWWNRTLPES